MAFCTTCGADATDKEFCSNCGSKVSAQTTAAPQGYAAPQSFTPQFERGVGPATTNVLAIVSLVCGVLGFFTGITSLGGIICGHLALSQINTTKEQGRGMAIAGLVTGYVVLAGGILLVIGLVALGTAYSSNVNGY